MSCNSKEASLLLVYFFFKMIHVVYTVCWLIVLESEMIENTHNIVDVLTYQVIDMPQQ